MATVKLGQKVRDEITGLEGVVVCRAEWLNGCVRISVQPQELKDGRPVEMYTFDEPQAIILDANGEGAKNPSGGDRPSPQRARDPQR